MAVNTAYAREDSAALSGARREPQQPSVCGFLQEHPAGLGAGQVRVCTLMWQAHRPCFAIPRGSKSSAASGRRLAHYWEQPSFQLPAYYLLDKHLHFAIETGKPPLFTVMAGRALLEVSGHVQDELDGAGRLEAPHEQVTGGSEAEEEIVGPGLSRPIVDRGDRR